MKGLDHMKEYNECGDNSDYKDYIFNYDNNDGQLYIWIDTRNKTIKYALTDCVGEVPMTAVHDMALNGLNIILITAICGHLQINTTYYN